MIGGKELVRRLALGSDLVVTPLIDAGGQIGEASLDIRLGPDIIVSRRAIGAIAFDAADGKAFREAIKDRQDYVRRGFGESFHLQPGEFAIARSLEYLALPKDLSAEALGRSSLGRLGLVIATATMIQPGFKGTITLELTNVGNAPLVLQIGIPIAQVVFHRIDADSPRTKVRDLPHKVGRERLARKWWSLRPRKASRYDGQLKPAVSRLDQEKDLKWIPPIGVKYILGVVGMPFSGKASAVNFLVGRQQFRLYHLSQFLYDEARRVGFDTSDKVALRKLGSALRERHGSDALSRLAFFRIRSEFLASDRQRDPMPIVVSGFRTAAEVRAWHSIGRYRSLVLTAPDGVRLERAERAQLFREEQLAEKPAEREQALHWFRTEIDGKFAARGILEAAGESEEAIEIDNGGGVPALHHELGVSVRRLDRWWREKLL